MRYGRIAAMTMRDRVKELRRVPASELRANPKNWRRHPPSQEAALRGVLEDIGFADAVIARETNDGLELIDGHLRQEVMGDQVVPVLIVDVTEEEADKMLLTHDPLAIMAHADTDQLLHLLRDTQFESKAVFDMLEALVNGERDVMPDLTEPVDVGDRLAGSLSARFLVPPFSVLDARQGYWQERKRAWLALGIESELGRGSSPSTSARADDPSYREIGTRKPNATPGGSPREAATLVNGHTVRGDGTGRPLQGESWSFQQGKRVNPHLSDEQLRSLGAYASTPQKSTVDRGTGGQTGTSIFDPVLCEIAYRWFSPPIGSILDPFAGGSVRGIVAAYLGRKYTGVDLRPEQVTANQEQAQTIVPDNMPTWIVGDSRTAIPTEEYDLIFSCPPYYDLEQYSDDAADLSNAGDYDSFILGYRQIVQTSVDRLRPDSFACFVVGDIRDNRGIYRNFVGDTVDAFQDAGANLYNEAILVTAVGSLPIRVGRQFEAGRKLGKTHQNVLIFYKGDPGRIRDRLGDVDVSEALSMFETDDV
jgi:DNA modification methylase